jgi:adenine-specific DNA-methyltransferase
MPTLHWIGKEKVINHHQDVPYRVLEHKYGFTADTGQQSEDTNSGNLILHGDNLEALKSLLPKYESKVKCIYIDPPYNTGEEGWVYNDNVNDPRFKKWLGQLVGKESEDLSRHDKWLCMLYPRLKLLQKLLSDDGAIFISIDDNEQANLKLICDEIFGIGNFISTFIWEKRTNRENRKEISYRHDYIIAYRKSKVPGASMKLLSMSGEALARYNNPDKDPRGLWKSDPATAQAGHATESQFYVLTTPRGKVHHLQSGRCWVYTEPVMQEAIRDNRIWFGKDGNGVPRLKTYLDSKERGLVPETIWFSVDVGTNESAKVELKYMFDGKAVFETPKPWRLIERVLNIASEKNSIILDSFAGTGSTAHAVLNLNKVDGGNRKFILVEMEDYAETITAERVRKVISGYSDKEGTGGGFNYYELGKPLFVGDNSEFLNEEVETEQIREYVWYSETRTAYNSPIVNPQSEMVNTNPYFLGIKEETAYYFIYEKESQTTLDFDMLSTITTKAGQYVVYADNCLLPKDFMMKQNIIFKKIPRDVTRF